MNSNADEPRNVNSNAKENRLLLHDPAQSLKLPPEYNDKSGLKCRSKVSKYPEASKKQFEGSKRAKKHRLTPR